MAIFFLAMPVFLSLVLWEALARSTQLDRGRVLMAHWRRTTPVALSLLGTRFKSRRRTNGQWRASRDKNSSKSGGMSIKSQDLQNIDDLKKVVPHGFSVFSLESAMTIKQQSFLVSNMCGEFMVCGGRRVWSINLLNRAVCSEESRVMSIEGVTPLTCVIVCAVRPSRRKSPTKSFAIQMRSIYTAGRRAL